MNETPPSGAPADADGGPVPHAGSPTHARRPAAVTILAALQLLSAAAFLLLFVGLLAVGRAALDDLTGAAAVGVDDAIDLEIGVVAVLVGGLCVATLASGILLLRMRQLGWTITMLLAGLGLASSLYLWWAQGSTLTIPVMVQVVTVFYLNQRQVRVAFGISRRRASDTFDLARG